jgi:protein transport protein SEC61 subunit gamma and related proteins
MSVRKQKKGGIFNLVTSEISAIRNFWNKLVQPSREQFLTSIRLQAMAIGLVGIVGYVIKLVHIPINNILVNKPN